MIYTITNVYAIRMAGVFMLSLGTIWVRTRAMPRVLVVVTYLLAIVLLLVINLSLWVIMIFPLWVLAVSIYILVVSLRGQQSEAEGAVGAAEINGDTPAKEPTMKPRSLAAYLLSAGVLLVSVVLGQASPAAAQDQPGRFQRITERMQAGETHAYLLKDLQAGDRLTAAMRSTSGNLDPAIGIIDTTTPLEVFGTRYRADLQRALAADEGVAEAIEEVRNQYFLAWDDDSGDGYAAALTYVVPTSGDYVLLAGGSLSALGRATSGDYTLGIGLNAPDAQDGAAVPVGAPIAERIAFPWGAAASVEEASGTLTAAAPVVSLKLVDIDAGQNLICLRGSHRREPDSAGDPARLRRQGARSRQSGRPGHRRRRCSTR